MKKAIMTVSIAAALLGSCKAQLPQKLQEQIDAKQEEYSRKASEEMKDAFSSQLQEFIKSSDLSDSLGISSEEQDKIQQSLKDYVDQYELSEEELDNAQKALTDLIIRGSVRIIGRCLTFLCDTIDLLYICLT